MTEFLLGPWSQVVAESQLSCVDGTVDSQGYLALVDDLASAAPFDTAQPGKIVRLVPQLLGQLRQGLKLIDFPEERISVFFDELITLHETAFESHRLQLQRTAVNHWMLT